MKGGMEKISKMKSKKLHINDGDVIGILGGTFDPPHAGHLYISHQAIELLNLDSVVWFVSPQNHLKDESSSFKDRFEMCKQFVKKEKEIQVSDFEKDYLNCNTAKTLEELSKIYPNTKFVWIMGVDNLPNFHKWQNWEKILEHSFVAIFDRKGYSDAIIDSSLYKRFPCVEFHDRITIQKGYWCYIKVPTYDISSTELREMSKQVKSRKRQVQSSSFEDELKDFLVKLLDENKAEEISVIDLKDKADFARYMLIATARSRRHVEALADNIIFELKHDKGMIGITAEGKGSEGWIVVDAYDVIVHIFTSESRSVYNLEQIWGLNSNA